MERVILLDPEFANTTLESEVEALRQELEDREKAFYWASRWHTSSMKNIEVMIDVSGPGRYVYEKFCAQYPDLAYYLQPVEIRTRPKGTRR